jgi:hypothetical protein
MDPFSSLVRFHPRNGGMADGKNGRMVEWREWLHTYYLRCTHTDTDDDDDDTLIFYSIETYVQRFDVLDDECSHLQESLAKIKFAHRLVCLSLCIH